MVTKGKIFFCTSLFFCKADFRSVNSTSEVIFFCEILVRVTSSACFFFVFLFSYKDLAEGLVFRTIRASPFMRPFIV